MIGRHWSWPFLKPIGTSTFPFHLWLGCIYDDAFKEYLSYKYFFSFNNPPTLTRQTLILGLKIWDCSVCPAYAVGGPAEKGPKVQLRLGSEEGGTLTPRPSNLTALKHSVQWMHWYKGGPKRPKVQLRLGPMTTDSESADPRMVRCRKQFQEECTPFWRAPLWTFL
jgi:hypothetical protein